MALVKAASLHQGRLTLAAAMRVTGQSEKDVKRLLDEMAIDGYIELDSDDVGNEFYYFPGL